MSDAAAAAPTPTGPQGPGASSSPLTDAWRTLRRRPDTIVAAAVLVFFAVMAAFPRLFTDTSPRACPIREARTAPQGWGGEHPFGTDALGCDVLAHMVQGSSVACAGIVVVGVSLVIGVSLGCLAGFYLGWVDYLVSRTRRGLPRDPAAAPALLVLSLFHRASTLRRGQRSTSSCSSSADPVRLDGHARYVRAEHPARPST